MGSIIDINLTKFIIFIFYFFLTSSFFNGYICKLVFYYFIINKNIIEFEINFIFI